MTSLEITLAVLGAGIAPAIIYLIAAFIRRSTEMKLKGFIMLLSPPVGALCFFGRFIISNLSGGGRGVSPEDLGFSWERTALIQHPDMEGELQSVPLEELFIVSGEHDKRRRLLSELKKDYISNYAMILKALDNDDPETAHYAAAAITNARADFERDIRALDSVYAHNRSNAEVVRAYSERIMGFLKSGMLDDHEMKRYAYLWLGIMIADDIPDGVLDEAYYAEIVSLAILVGDYALAERWAEEAYALGESEMGYVALLKVYYYTNRPELFFAALDSLKQSDVQLSPDGLSLVRFFIRSGSPMARKEA